MDLAQYLEKTGTTRAAFAIALRNHGVEVSQQAVKWWEEGERNPSPKNIPAIEKATAGKVTRHDLRPDIYGPAPKAKRRAA